MHQGVSGIRVLSSLNIEAAGSSNDELRRHLTRTLIYIYQYPRWQISLSIHTAAITKNTPGRHLIFEFESGALAHFGAHFTPFFNFGSGVIAHPRT